MEKVNLAEEMSELITLTIDDQKISVNPGLMVVDAAKMAGIDISVFCYHPKLEPVGACRLCLVEIGRPQRDRSTGEVLLGDDGSPQVYFSGNLETACTVPVAEGMVVRCNNEKVLKARENILEFILTSHPLDCPICDKGGECSLQEICFSYGLGESRFPLNEKIKLGKHLPLGSLILLDQERCIQCGRCIRFQREIAADPVLAFYHRGRKTEVVSFSDPPFDSYWSGNTTDICPVGALTTKDFRFEARIWEMDSSPSICSHCPVGCNITFNTRLDPKTGRKTIQRLMPRQNEWVNELWICDKGRFAHKYGEAKERITKPLARNNKGELKPVSWEKALKIATDNFQSKTDGLVTLVGGRLSNEDLYQLRLFTDAFSGMSVLDSCMGGGDLVSKVGLGEGSNLKEVGPETAILVVACDLEEEAPLWYLRIKAASERGAKLILINPRETKLDRYADHILGYEYGDEAQAVIDFDSKKSPAGEDFKTAKNGIILFGSEGMDFSASKVLAQACANLLIKTKHYGKPNNGLIPVWPGANIQGAWDMGFQPVEDLGFILFRAESLIIAGADPVGDGLIEDLNDKFMIVQELFLTETAAQADLVLPATPLPEKSGTFTSGERRVQRFEKALPGLGESKADYEITAELGQALGLEMATDSDSILEEIIQNIPGYHSISLTSLREVPEQWPLVSKAALSYTGTIFKNTAGVGQQTSLEAKTGELKAAKISVEKSKSHRGLLAVPVTRLMDQAITLRYSPVLGSRLSQDQIILNPEDAKKVGVNGQEALGIKFKEKDYLVSFGLDKTVPPGVVLIPRSMGIPVGTPETIRIEKGKKK
jgi:NADH-quinone oxidoreductase subunit G